MKLKGNQCLKTSHLIFAWKKNDLLWPACKAQQTHQMLLSFTASPFVYAGTDGEQSSWRINSVVLSIEKNYFWYNFI